jgi:AraC-like DNA-binding protein
MASISTGSISYSDAPEYWDEQCSKLLCLGSIKTEPLGKRPFRGYLQCNMLKNGIILNKFDIESGRFVANIDGTPEVLTVVLPLVGDDEAAWNHEKFRVSPGRIYIANTYENIEVSAPNKVKRLIVHIPKDHIREIFPDIDSPGFAGTHTIPTQNLAAALFVKNVHDLNKCVNPTGMGDIGESADNLAKSLTDNLRCIFRNIQRQDGDAGSRLRHYHKERIKTFVESHLHESMDIKSIAREVKLSQSYIYNLFSTDAVSLMKWVWNRRLERCRQDLESPAKRNCAIWQIAYTWGFNDPAHFTHAFCRHFGMSPTQYRDQYHNVPI